MVSRQMQQEQFSRQQQPVGVANPYFQQVFIPGFHYYLSL